MKRTITTALAILTAFVLGYNLGQQAGYDNGFDRGYTTGYDYATGNDWGEYPDDEYTYNRLGR